MAVLGKKLTSSKTPLWQWLLLFFFAVIVVITIGTYISRHMFQKTPANSTVKTYLNDRLGFSFSYPKSSTIVNDAEIPDNNKPIFTYRVSIADYKNIPIVWEAYDKDKKQPYMYVDVGPGTCLEIFGSDTTKKVTVDNLPEVMHERQSPGNVTNFVTCVQGSDRFYWLTAEYPNDAKPSVKEAVKKNYTVLLSSFSMLPSSYIDVKNNFSVNYRPRWNRDIQNDDWVTFGTTGDPAKQLVDESFLDGISLFVLHNTQNLPLLAVAKQEIENNWNPVEPVTYSEITVGEYKTVRVSNIVSGKGPWGPAYFVQKDQKVIMLIAAQPTKTNEKSVKEMVASLVFYRK